MIYEPKLKTAAYRNAVILMLNTAAHFRKAGNFVAARRAVATLQSWRAA